MGLSGDLSSVKLADIFQMLSMSQDKQVLTISNGDNVKHFTFAGNKIFVALNVKKLGPIGQLLVNLGKMTEEQLNTSLLDQQKNGGRLGEVIMRLGFATQHEVEGVFRMQMEEEVYEVLEWGTGSFQVRNPEDVDKGDASEVELSFDVVSILMESARRIDEWQTIRKHLPSPDDIYAKTNAFNIDVNDKNQPPVHRTLAKYIDGVYSLRELIAKLMLPRFEVMAAMHQLLGENKLRRLSGQELLKVAQAHLNLQKLDSAFLILERAAQLEPANIELVDKIAGAYLQADRKTDAARHYATLANTLVARNNESAAVDYANKCLKADRYNVPMRLLIFNQAVTRSKLAEAVNSGRYLLSHFTEKQDIENGVAVCNAILTAQPDNTEFRGKLIEILANAGDLKGALQQCEYLEQFLAKDNLQMIKIYRTVQAKFPGEPDITEHITRLTSRHSSARTGKVALISAVAASAVAGILVAWTCFNTIDRLFNL